MIGCKHIFAATLLTATALCLEHSGSAQDYPYDDSTAGVNGDDSEIPTEIPSSAKQKNIAPQSKRRRTSLLRIGLKAGLVYGIYQQSAPLPANNISQTGVGFEAALSVGWDLPYQPIFLELESGYRNYNLNGDFSALHIIPIRVGIFYRKRIGESTLWKLGIAPSLDIRISNTVDTSESSLVPAISLSNIFEFNAFLVEPVATIHRIKSDDMFLAFALRAGIRF